MRDAALMRHGSEPRGSLACVPPAGLRHPCADDWSCLCVLFRLPRSQPMFITFANTCFFFWGVAPLIVSRSASCTALHRDGASAYGCQPQMALRASLGNAAGVRSSRLLFCCAFLASRASNSSEAFGVSQEEGYAIATLRRGLCALCGHLW